jgi:TatD DNase family protein
MHAVGLTRAVVNGTSELDWPAVAEFSRSFAWIQPSFGLHPWKVGAESPEWAATLRSFLLCHPSAGVGEVGLDRWIEPHDLPKQCAVLRTQVLLASELERPLTLHCLKAWGALAELLSDTPLPSRGFLLHAYGGPLEMIPLLERLGAYFSFSPSFLNPRKAWQRQNFRTISRERLLVETDAPDLSPPSELNRHPLVSADGRAINHPANLELAYEGLSETLKIPLSTLEEQITENFYRLFGPDLEKPDERFR